MPVSISQFRSMGITVPEADAWVEKLARFGYATKGVVYCIVGVLATMTAFGQGGETTGTKGAVNLIAGMPFGRTLLVLTALGLLGYVAWRFVQAVMDPGGRGTDAKGIAARVGIGISGISYLLLALYAMGIVLGSGGGSGDDSSSKQAWTAELMSQPFGIWLVGLIGLVVLGVGLYHFWRAYQASFMRSYNLHEMSDSEITWALRLGRVGLVARGITFSIIGGFFLQAAWQADPSEARGLGAALASLRDETPWGSSLLGVVALGLVAYGVYCFSRAKYRYFRAS
ncbi:MAG: DUF1206 domain-containing protein [Planctomycetaceae bacterium]|nr:DUF1206 domain-containing protein [Planctomycetaceae bacterium]